MAALAVTHPTLLDLAKRLDPKGNVDPMIVEMLEPTNEWIDDIVWIEANQETGHKTTVRTGLPTPTWRKLYGGVQPTKSTTAQVTDSIGFLEAYAEVDKKLADLNGNTAAFRLSEDRAHIMGMGKEFSDTLVYGNEGSEPEAFTGFAPRFNSLGADNADNIIQSGTTPDKSIFIVVWGPNTVHCIYPRGSKTGWQATDKGQVTIESIDGAGGRMEGYRTHYSWDCGLCVRDWRYVVRIQYDESEMLATAATGPDLPDLLTRGLERIESLSMGRPAIYMNRTARTMLRRQMISKTSDSTLSWETMAGKKVMAFGEVPVRRLDSLATTTETTIP